MTKIIVEKINYNMFRQIKILKLEMVWHCVRINLSFCEGGKKEDHNESQYFLRILRLIGNQLKINKEIFKGERVEKVSVQGCFITWNFYGVENPKEGNGFKGIIS